MMHKMRYVTRLLAVATGIAAAIAAATPAQATEGGASLYLLGSGGPGVAEMPPLEGVYFDNMIWVYSGEASASRQFVVGGNVVAGLDATIVADFATALWVPSTNVLGGTLAVGGILPVGAPMVDVNAILTGPLGNQFSASRRDSDIIVGDPVATAALGWKAGKAHIQASTLVNIPVGHYRENQLANLSFHRWIIDGSLAVTWKDEASGWDLSSKAGVTFNGNNDFTDYDSGNEFHWEAAVGKSLSKSFSAGLQGYWLKQLSGDSGAGARLGPFKGEVFGVGATAAWNTVLGRSPATIRGRFMKEFDATNRLEGESYWLELSLPLYMKMPPHAGG